MVGNKFKLVIKSLILFLVLFCLSSCKKKSIINLKDSDKIQYGNVKLTRGLPKVDRNVELEENVTTFSLNVPLLNQMDYPELKYGCEVTALAMLLGYYGFENDKNVLQAKIQKVPYCDEEGYFGNPDRGFVGDATGHSPGTGVNHGPIAEVAKKFINKNYVVTDSTGVRLTELLENVKEGNPVWIVVSIDYEIPQKKDLIEWYTEDGVTYLNKKHHAAILTGYDEKNVFLNDALGQKISVDRDKFNDIYKMMGKQSVYLSKVNNELSSR